MTMTYKGYVGQLEIDEDEHVLRGRVVNLGKDTITFSGETVADAKRDFERGVDEYLEWAREDGFEAEKPLSGRYLLRMSPELHREVVAAATVAGRSVNQFIVEALEKTTIQRQQTAATALATPQETSRHLVEIKTELLGLRTEVRSRLRDLEGLIAAGLQQGQVESTTTRAVGNWFRAAGLTKMYLFRQNDVFSEPGVSIFSDLGFLAVANEYSEDLPEKRSAIELLTEGLE